MSTDGTPNGAERVHAATALVCLGWLPFGPLDDSRKPQEPDPGIMARGVQESAGMTRVRHLWGSEGYLDPLPGVRSGENHATLP